MNYNLNQIMSDNRGDEYFTELLMCGWFAIYMEPVNIEELSLQESVYDMRLFIAILFGDDIIKSLQEVQERLREQNDFR